MQLSEEHGKILDLFFNENPDQNKKNEYDDSIRDLLSYLIARSDLNKDGCLLIDDSSEKRARELIDSYISGNLDSSDVSKFEGSIRSIDITNFKIISPEIP